MSTASISIRSIGKDVSTAVIATMALLSISALVSQVSLTTTIICSVLAILACLWLCIAAINDLVWPVRRGPGRNVHIFGDWLLITGGIAGTIAAAGLILSVLGA